MDHSPLHLGSPLAQAQAACVFVHGRGQTPETMQADVIRHLTVPGVGYILPRATGSSWYTARAVDPLTDQTRSELAASLVQLGDSIALAPKGIPLLLAGFSQGACLSLEYAFANGPWQGALVALTGARVGIATDPRPAANLDHLPAYLTGGDTDPWIPLHAFAEAAAALGTAQARLRAEIFPGRPHEVSPPEIAQLNAMLASLAAGRPVTFEVMP